VTGGASFCWNGHAKEYELYVRGPEGMPFHGNDNPYTVSARYIDIVSDVMTDEVLFHRMTPQDYLLTEHDPLRVWCLAESGRQYLTFSTAGEPFTLHLAAGDYTRNFWIDARTGEQVPAAEVQVAAGDVTTEKSAIAPDERRIGTRATAFTPPDNETDWVLLVRTSD